MSKLESELRDALLDEQHRCLREGHAFDVADAMAAVNPWLEQLEGPHSCTDQKPCETRQGLGQQLTRAQETNARLNRRCQAAEAAALQNVKACVGVGLSFSRTLANWYALRLIDELRQCLEIANPEIATLLRSEVLEAHRRRITHALPEEGDMMRWRQKQTQPKASVRDGEFSAPEPECEVCHGPCQGH